MIVIRNSKVPCELKPPGRCLSSGPLGLRMSKVSKEESVRLMQKYIRAWESADSAGLKHELPRIERMIVDVFIGSGAKLDAEAKRLIRLVELKRSNQDPAANAR